MKMSHGVSHDTRLVLDQCRQFDDNLKRIYRIRIHFPILLCCCVRGEQVKWFAAVYLRDGTWIIYIYLQFIWNNIKVRVGDMEYQWKLNTGP